MTRSASQQYKVALDVKKKKQDFTQSYFFDVNFVG